MKADPHCVDCGAVVGAASQRCRLCASNQNRKHPAPPPLFATDTAAAQAAKMGCDNVCRATVQFFQARAAEAGLDWADAGARLHAGIPLTTTTTGAKA